MNAIVESTVGGVIVSVHVIPRAAKSGLSGVRNGALLVRLVAPPVDDAANDELIALMASLFAIPRRGVSILSGAKNRSKRLKLTGVTMERASTLLEV